VIVVKNRQREQIYFLKGMLVKFLAFAGMRCPKSGKLHSVGYFMLILIVAVFEIPPEVAVTVTLDCTF
jgi:hypothetical protein